MLCDSLYGSYRNVKFCDLYPDSQSFAAAYAASQLPLASYFVPNDDPMIPALYYLLYGRYGNSTIASSDTKQFEYKLFTVVFMYGPAWLKRLELQKNIQGLSLDDLAITDKSVANAAYNNATALPTADAELAQINNQSVQYYKRGALEAYAAQWDMLETDVTEEFLQKFAKLFLQFVAPEGAELYEIPEV